MHCKCSIVNSVLAVIIIIFAFWSAWTYSKWVVIAAAVVLLVHELMHKHSHGSKDSGKKK